MGKIYVADLGDYNNGELRGRWIDMEDISDEDDLWEQIKEMLSVKPGHDEWMVYDYEDFPDLGKHPSVEDLVSINELVNEYGGELVSELYKQYEDVKYIEKLLVDGYYGEYKDKEDFAMSMVEEQYGDLHKLIGNLAYYIDYEAYARDLESDFTFIELPNGNVAVFAE